MSGVEGKDRKTTSWSKPNNYHHHVNKAANTVGKSELQSPFGIFIAKDLQTCRWL